MRSNRWAEVIMWVADRANVPVGVAGTGLEGPVL